MKATIVGTIDPRFAGAAIENYRARSLDGPAMVIRQAHFAGKPDRAMRVVLLGESSNLTVIQDYEPIDKLIHQDVEWRHVFEWGGNRYYLLPIARNKDAFKAVREQFGHHFDDIDPDEFMRSMRSTYDEH